ncbi:MAG: cell division protein FtsA [Rhizobiaceae bacterium]|nr:cell division protein FtsA [Rhizobiaceae bacterium]
MSWLGKQNASGAGRAGIITVLDVGSTKVCCVVAQLRPAESSQQLRGRTHKAKVIGIGHQRSHGVKSGVVVDLDRAEHAIRLAVDSAERMAGLTIDSLIVNLTAGRLKSHIYTATVNLGGHEVGDGDVRRVLAAGAKQSLKADRDVVHALPVTFSLDGERGVRDPRGMVGETLGVDMHVMTGDAAPQRNLELCINRSHLSVERMVATPYASGLAALVDDELEMGAACIDMGGGTTTISVFSEGKFVHGDALPIGGGHVTLDLAKGLSTRFEDAERLKVMHGTLVSNSGDDRLMVTVLPIGSEDGDVPLQVPQSVVTRIVRARVEETLELLRDRLNKSGYGNVVGKRVVLTGGGSQLAGMPDTARRILGRNVRIGRPLGVSSLPEAAKGPAFAAAVGLMIYPQMAEFENGRIGASSRFRSAGTGGRLQRMGQWFKDSF